MIREDSPVQRNPSGGREASGVARRGWLRIVEGHHVQVRCNLVDCVARGDETIPRVALHTKSTDNENKLQ